MFIYQVGDFLGEVISCLKARAEKPQFPGKFVNPQYVAALVPNSTQRYRSSARDSVRERKDGLQLIVRLQDCLRRSDDLPGVPAIEFAPRKRVASGR